MYNSPYEQSTKPQMRFFWYCMIILHVLWLPLTVLKYACEAKWKLNIVYRCDCDCECECLRPL